MPGGHVMVRLPWIRSLFSFPIVKPWANHLASLSLGFPHCKMGPTDKAYNRATVLNEMVHVKFLG